MKKNKLGIVGVLASVTIASSAVAGSYDYDAEIKALEGLNPANIPALRPKPDGEPVSRAEIEALKKAIIELVELQIEQSKLSVMNASFQADLGPLVRILASNDLERSKKELGLTDDEFKRISEYLKSLEPITKN